MLNIIRIALAIMVIALSSYSLLTKNFEVSPYTMFSLGALMLVIGMSEFQKERKQFGFISMIVSVFIFFVSIQGFLYS